MPGLVFAATNAGRGCGRGKGRETGTADMACGESQGRIAAIDRLPEGVAVLGRNAGLWLVGKAAEEMPGNLNRGNSQRVKPGKDCRG